MFHFILKGFCRDWLRVFFFLPSFFKVLKLGLETKAGWSAGAGGVHVSFGVFFGRVLPPGLVAPRRGDCSAGFDRASLIREAQKTRAFLQEIFLRCHAGGSSFLAKDLGWWEPRKLPGPWLLLFSWVASPEEEKEQPRKSPLVLLVMLGMKWEMNSYPI